MTGGRTAPRIFVVASVLTLVVAVVGFIVTLVLNAFVLDKYNAYGEVPIPGSSSLHLPAGEATVSFHTQTIGSPSGGGLPVPPLGLTIVPPEGIPDPQVTESFGTTTTVNNDAHIRVWRVQIPAEGTYDITTDGKVNGYINPQLAFGHDASYGPAGVGIRRPVRRRLGGTDRVDHLRGSEPTGADGFVPAADRHRRLFRCQRPVHADGRRDPVRSAQEPQGAA